jgi:ferredoxin
MPWVNEEMCVGCGVCVDECPVDAISLNDGTALINQATCIRCGTCHDVCPQEAVRHDSERIPQEVEANVQWARSLLRHFDSEEERASLIERLRKHFNMQRKIIDQSLAGLQSLK